MKDAGWYRETMTMAAAPLQLSAWGARCHSWGDGSSQSGTIATVEQDFALLLARASRLSERAMHELWERGDSFVRRTLAGRADLPVELQRLCVADPELIGWWAGTKPRDPELVAVAALNATTEPSIVQLAQQPALNHTAFKALASKATPPVCWSLLDHPGLPQELRPGLVCAFITRSTIESGRSWNELMERIGEKPEAVRAALDAVGWAQHGVVTSLIRAVATIEAERPGELFEAALAMFERLDRETRVPSPDVRGTQEGPETRAERFVRVASHDLLRNPWLSEEQLRRLESLTIMRPDHVELRRRIAADVASHLSVLSCGPTALVDDPAHAKALNELARHSDLLRLPEQVALEALLHRDTLDVAVVERCVSHLTLGVRHVVAALEVAHRYDLLTELAVQLGMRVVDALEDPAPVLRQLASENGPELRAHLLPAEHVELVATTYKPLTKLLHEPALLGVVLERLETLPDPAREIATALLHRWEGDLTTLVETATTLAHTPGQVR